MKPAAKEDARSAHRRIDAHQLRAETESLAERRTSWLTDQERVGSPFEEHSVELLGADETAGAFARLKNHQRWLLAALRTELADPVRGGQPADAATDHGEANGIPH